MTDSASDRCTATREDGARCETRIGLRNGLCFVHDPERRDVVQEGRARGAEMANAARRTHVQTISPEEALPEPKTLEDCGRWQSWAVWAVATGKIDARTAHEIATLITGLRLTLQHNQEKLLRELEAEVRKLRRRLEEREREL